MSNQPPEQDNPPADPPKNDPPAPPQNDPPKPPENQPDFTAFTAALGTLPESIANSVKEVLDGWKPPVADPPKNDPPKNDPPKNDPPKEEPPVPGKRTLAQWWFGA